VLDVEEKGESKRLVFTGDLGRKRIPILRDPEPVAGAHALMIESTYGDRLHPAFDDMHEELAGVIQRVHSRGGRILIPSFALERAQEILLVLKSLRREKRIPPMPVYVDSPLAIQITDVFKLHPECFDRETRALVREPGGPFDFPELRYTATAEESMAIDASSGPCIVIAGSGMCEGGRILHHLRRSVEDDKNCVLIVGYQASHTLGRRIAERRQRVRIFGVERDLRAEVVVLGGFSAHADQRELVEYVEEIRSRGPLSQVILVHGDPPAQRALREKLEATRPLVVRVPEEGEKLTI
jgi:metallo-beta-lactamase family protein